MTGYIVYRIVPGSHRGHSSGGSVGLRRTIVVQQIAIAVNHRGRGLGRFALDWLVQRAVDDGIDCIELGSTIESLPFYQRFGFIGARCCSLTGLEGCLQISFNLLLFSVSRSLSIYNYHPGQTSVTFFLAPSTSSRFQDGHFD